MPKMVTLTIDGKKVQAPEGTLIVNAAKMVGIDIPVFCYHPKMEPVGMCRLCLVEIGRPMVDRATGQPVLNEDGTPKIQFGPKLEISCATPISEGMVVLGASDKARAGRDDILEFLLTSHPLDCPICDKGGECPLQNLTMHFGPGKSRFLYDEKMRLAKHYPLGDLIVLDRERCIQCARCIRFQTEIVDDPVIGFSQRARHLEIISISEPGFDSYYSGNTTDICPVGALTTTDFRFKARPWELKASASICTQCPVGCNLTFNTRREASSGGEWVIKRAMPRQNEQVNEIWICDKGRFGYHYARSRTEAGPMRLSSPMIRRNGELTPATWEDALDLIAERFKAAGSSVLGLAGGRLSNEDLFNLKSLMDGVGGKSVLYSTMAGGDLTGQVGLGQGSNLGELGPESAILVVACDLEEEAPIWWLRVKQAADRGAKLIVVNPRPTKLDRAATHSLRYPYGAEAAMILAFGNALSAKRPDLPEAVSVVARSPELQTAAQAFAAAENAIILYGSEGAGLEASQALAQACANLLIATNHVGRANNGLMGVWQRANEQGAWDLGFRPAADLEAELQAAQAIYVAAADPAGDDPTLAEAGRFLVVQDMYMTDTARLADVVLPVQSFTEREGSFTNGERRVQRFYPAVPEPANSLADFAVFAKVGKRLGLDMEDRLASRVMDRIAAKVPAYSGTSYQKLAEVVEQWPIVGRGDMYYGGTSYQNSQGLGVQIQPAAQRGESAPLSWAKLPEWDFSKDSLVAVPITRLYDRGLTLLPSTLLQQRIPDPYIILSAEDAARLKIENGGRAQVTINGASLLVNVRVEAEIPARMVLVPRSMGLPITNPAPVEVKAIERMAA